MGYDLLPTVKVCGVDSTGAPVALPITAGGKLDVSASVSGMTEVEYHATPPTLADGGTDGLQADPHGGLKVTPVDSSGAPVYAVAEIAHDAVDDATGPVKIGGTAVAQLSAATLVSAADRTRAAFDLDGAMIFRRNAPLGDKVSAVATNTDGTSTTCIAAQAAGIKTYLTDITLANSSATFVTVDIRDGAAGTVKWTFPVPPSGGVTHAFNSPIAGSAATAWCFDPSAAASTITCSMGGFLSKV